MIAKTAKHLDLFKCSVFTPRKSLVYCPLERDQEWDPFRLDL